jgi:hypothetical protein
MASEKDQVIIYLDQLIASTAKDTVAWAKANPTTYVWHPPQQGGSKIIIQRIERVTNILEADPRGGARRRIDNDFVFQVLDPASVEKLLVDGRNDPVFNAKLKTLFEGIESSLTRKGLSFFKSILPPAP